MYVTGILFSSEVYAQTDYLRSISEGRFEKAHSVKFSPDGTMLATAGHNNCIFVWDVETRRRIAVLEEQRAMFGEPLYPMGKTLAFSPNGKMLASVCEFDHVKLWDIETWKEIATLSVQPLSHWDLDIETHPLGNVRFGPDGKLLAACCNGEMIQLWDVATRKSVGSLSDGSRIFSLAFSPDGKTLAATSDKEISIWDLSSRKKTLTLDGLGKSDTRYLQSCPISFSQDGTMLAAAGGDSKIKIWDAQTYKLTATYTEHTKPISSVIFSSDSKSLISAGEDAVLRIWNIAEGETKSISSQDTAGILDLSLSSNEKKLASGAEDGTVRLWEMATGQGEILSKPPIANPAHEGEILKIKFRPDGKILATAGLGKDNNSTTLKLWNANDGITISTMEGHRGNVWMLRFADNGKSLISRDNEGVLIEWNSTTGTQIGYRKQNSYSTWPSAAAFNSDGSKFIAGDYFLEDPSIVTFATKKPFDIDPLLEGTYGFKKSDLLVGHSNRVWAVAFSPDDKTIASGEMGGVLKLWNADTHLNLATWKGHQSGSYILSVAYSPDSTILASAGWENNIKLWDATNGKLLYTINTGGIDGHLMFPSSIEFHPDGKSIASAGMEKTIKFWRVPDRLVK